MGGCRLRDTIGYHLDDTLVERLHRRAKAGQWRLTVDRFGAALAASAESALGAFAPSRKEIEKYLHSLRLEDLALACACADGDEEAWEHFVREVRPTLYRAAGALDPTGGARDIADSIYADLYGLQERDGVRRSLLRYFHGRSSIATWVRSVLAQRYVDRVRAAKRVEPLGDENEGGLVLSVPCSPPDPDRGRYIESIRHAFGRALAALAPRERLRLACYYEQQLTLAQTGRVLREHEATVSRQLARTRRTIRADVERQLRDLGFSADELQAAFDSVVQDTGPIDLGEMLCKKPELDRSVSEEMS